jgi:Family of unknown function (DUF6220)
MVTSEKIERRTEMKKNKASNTDVPPSGSVRAGRLGYAILASAFLLGVVIQVFFAGVGVFGGDWSLHTGFVRFLALALPVMFVVSFVGRLPLALKAAPVGLVVLITGQFVFANIVGPVAVSALHTVNALAIFAVAGISARSAWRSALA